MKTAQKSFPAIVCKATIQTLTITKFFWGSTDSVPATYTKDLSADECQRMTKTLDCFSNPMNRIPGTNAYAFNGKPDDTSSWLTTTRNSIINCMTEPTKLVQSEKGGEIMGMAGSLGSDRSIGHANKGGMCFVWETNAPDVHKNCEFDTITQGKAHLYDLNNNQWRIRDSRHQVEFILDAEPANISCSFERPVHHVKSGFSDVLITIDSVGVMESVEEIPETRKVKRQVQERVTEREPYVESMSPSELAIQEARDEAKRQESYKVPNFRHQETPDPNPSPVPKRRTRTTTPEPVPTPNTQRNQDHSPPDDPKSTTPKMEYESTISNTPISEDVMRTELVMTSTRQQPEDQNLLQQEQERNRQQWQEEQERWNQERAAHHALMERERQRQANELESQRLTNQRLREEADEFYRKRETQRLLQSNQSNPKEERRWRTRPTTRPISRRTTQNSEFSNIRVMKPNANWVPEKAFVLLHPGQTTTKAKTQAMTANLQKVKDHHTHSDTIPNELMLSHLQYINDHQLAISNLLSAEIQQLDCQSRQNRAALINILAKQSGVRAAKLIGMSECHSITAHGAMALVHKCRVVTAEIKANKTRCGTEPTVEGKSLSLDGYTILPSFIPCLHDGHFVQVGETTYEYDQRIKDWKTTKETIQVSHSHLATTFNITADNMASAGMASFHEKTDHNLIDMMGELSAVMQMSGQTSISDALKTGNQDIHQNSNVPDIAGGIEHLFTGWRTTFISVIMTIGTVIGLVILCRSGIIRKLMTFKRKPKQPKPKERPVIYRKIPITKAPHLAIKGHEDEESPEVDELEITEAEPINQLQLGQTLVTKKMFQLNP
jgi:hypothetical protein